MAFEGEKRRVSRLMLFLVSNNGTKFIVGVIIFGVIVHAVETYMLRFYSDRLSEVEHARILNSLDESDRKNRLHKLCAYRDSDLFQERRSMRTLSKATKAGLDCYEYELKPFCFVSEAHCSDLRQCVSEAQLVYDSCRAFDQSGLFGRPQWRMYTEIDGWTKSLFRTGRGICIAQRIQRKRWSGSLGRRHG